MVFKCMAYAGLRLGEALAMRREYLSPGQGTYLVCQSYKTRAFGKPKRGKSRLVDLPAFLVADLEVYIDSLRRSSFRKGKGGRVDLLYVDPTGKGGWPISQRKIQYLMRKVCKTAGLRVRNPHDLRHFYASQLLMPTRASPTCIGRWGTVLFRYGAGEF
jgi:integrase